MDTFEKKHVGSRAAELVAYQAWPKVGIRVLVRRFPDVKDKHVQQLLEAVETYGDESNTTAGNIVTGPVVGGEEYPGDWRSVAVRQGRNKAGTIEQGIVQTLVQGEWSEADLVVMRDDCRVRISRRFYWMVEELPILDATTPGRVPELGPFTFDRETGTYNTYVEITERMYQDTRVGDDDPVAAADYFTTTQERKQSGVTTEAIPDMEFVEGQVRTQDIALDADCTKAVGTQTVTAEAREDVRRSKKIDLLSIDETTQDVNQPFETLLIDNYLDQETGQILEIEDVTNRFGLHDVSRNLSTARAFDEGPYILQADAFGRSVEVVRRKNVDQGVDPLPFDGSLAADDEGELTSYSGGRNRYGVSDYERTRRLAAETFYPPAAATVEDLANDLRLVDNINGNRYVRYCWNVRASNLVDVQQDFAARHPGMDIGGEPRPNPDQTFDIELTARPVKTYTSYNDSTWEGFGEESLRTNGDALYDSQGRRFFVRILRTSFASKALAYAQGAGVSGTTYGSTTSGYHVLGAHNGHETGRYYVGLGRWMGVRVEGLNTHFPTTYSGS